MRYLLILFTIATVLGCQSKEKAADAAPYPPVTGDYLENIIRNGDHIDVVFYKYPISMSRDGNADVIQELARITDFAPQTLGNCQPDGRIFYNGKGQTIAEADLYIQPNCNFIVFLQEGKPTFANTLTPEAIQFYDGLTKQFQGQ